MLVVQSHSSACPEHTRYLQGSQLRSFQGAGPVGPTSPCHLACETRAVRHNYTQWGCTSETLCMPKSLLQGKVRACRAPVGHFGSTVLAALRRTSQPHVGGR